MKRKIPIFSAITICFLIVCLMFSPYRYSSNFKKRILIETIKINAPAKQVYQYLGNSNNASEWSSFVSHIIPLNGEKFKDGTIGSIRRCFKNKNEKGETWDEEIIINELNQRRRLTVYNLKNFPISCSGLLTEQLYKTISKNQCQLSFSLFLNEEAGIIEHLKMYYASYQINEIFRKNLENIKRLNESKYRSTLHQSGEFVSESNRDN